MLRIRNLRDFYPCFCNNYYKDQDEKIIPQDWNYSDSTMSTDTQDFIYPLSDNAMKYAYFEAATLYHIEDSEYDRSVCHTKYKLLNNIMFDAAKSELEAPRQLFLMLIIHEAAKQYEDFETMGKVLTCLRNRKWGKDETALIDLYSNTAACLLMSPKMAAHLVINAGVKIQDAVTELEDLAFMVDDGEVEL